MKNSFNTRLTGAAATLAMMLAAWFTLASVAHADEMDDILKRGELVVAVQTQGPPVSFVDKKGERTGLAVEFAKQMAADLGVKVVFQDYDWKGLIPALLAGKADMIAGDMTPTPQRAAQLLFSRPMFFNDTLAFAAKDSQYKTWQDLNKEGVTVAALQGSTYADAVTKYLPKATLKVFAGGGPAVAQTLTMGRVDAMVGGQDYNSYVRQFENLKPLEGIMTREPLAFATRPNAFHLKMWLDNYVELKTADNSLQTLLAYWWTSDAWEKDHK
ncbi:transporter substrate-binding domain-containing protein (plasmid) [Mesorhizobium sp. B2-1-8]|uniref:transporter substrate-binding domain-containing protein n=1 Tax=unclassified Mesorhizobium TaxID=325217 RepID=UPI001AEE9FF8|nr:MULTISPECIES: transporter substrate-binding domain-containing protein [unclassified Mesorhizobium]UCI22753.1 transporter substrate-binding domain-containing protein [Mesorhizobium sp. B2-1-8]